MFDFLKTFGQGLLYLILSPFILIGVALNAIYSIIVFLFMFIKRIYMFFRGEDMKAEMKIDQLAKLHIKQQDDEEEIKEAITPTPVVNKNTTVVQPIIIQTDANGVLKSVKIANNVNNQIEQIESIEIPQIEAIEAEEGDLDD